LSSNANLAPGRLVLIAIDLSLVQPFGARFVTEAAGTLLDRLIPSDRVALASFPPPGPSVDFTADRDEVREALEGVVGRSDLRRRRITLTEALSFTRRRDPHEWEKALRRECSGVSGRGVDCVPRLESEAWQLVQEYESASLKSISTLKALFESLTSVGGPKSVVLISPGLHSEQRGRLRELGVKAAESGVSFYAVQLDQPVVDDASQGTRVSFIKDRALLSEGLDMVAALSRGKVFRMIGDGERAFDRIARELSGYYLLGFAPEPEDRDGEFHDVGVKVARKGVEVRPRRVVRIPGPGERHDDDEVRLARIASSPVLATELPLSAATYVTRNPESGRLRLLVSAIAGEESLPTSPAAVAFLLADSEGNVGANGFREAADVTLEAMGPDRFLSASDISPGRYTLRLAALDRRGRRGSVEHAVDAALASAGGLELSDLMLGEPPRGNAPFWPRASLAVGEGGLLYGTVEMFGEDPLLGAASVGFELTAAGGGSILLRGQPMPEIELGGGWRRVVGAFRTAALPPGLYRARAVVRKDGEILGAVEAPFRMRPRRERTGATVLASAAVAFAVDRFDARELLSAEPVRSVLELLPRPAGRAPSEALTQALADAEAGRLDRLVEDLEEEPSAGAATLFLRGLGLLSLGQVPAAIDQLELAEQEGFEPAALYLGASLAAAGQNLAAAEALERVRPIGLATPLVPSLLAGSWLRAGQPDRAVPVLREALAGQWGGHADLQRLMGLALAAQGDRAEAITLLEQALDTRPGDLGSLLVLLLLVEDSGDGDVEALGSRLRAYQAAAREPEQAIAEAWLSHFEGPKAEQVVRAEETPATSPVALEQPPETVAQYLDLVERYRAGQDTTAVLEAYSFDGIRDVVQELLTGPDACPRAWCREAAALMHTDAALALLGRNRIPGADLQLQAARWLLGFDVRLDDSASDPPESQESIEARQRFRNTWLLAVGRLLTALGHPSRALSYLEDCREFFPVGSLLAAGSAHELMGSIEGLVPMPARPGTVFGQSPPPNWFALYTRRAMKKALRDAESAYREAIQLEPGVAQAHLRLGRVLQRRGKEKQARAELVWVVENSPPGPLLALAQLFLGELEERRGRLDAAIGHLRLALRAEPDSQAARVALSHALHRSGEMPASNEAAHALLARRESGDSWLDYHFPSPQSAEATLAGLRREVRR
jgi:VWFA-related protein